MQEMHEINGRDIGMDSVAKSNSLIGNNEVDDFAKNPNELMKLSGLGHNFKRNAKRKLEKADQNSLNGDDSESKQLVPDKYGYGLFDVVEPPYNLISLSKIYEVSRKLINSGPNLIIANTTKGKGSAILENNKEWHQKAPKDEVELNKVIESIS